MTEWKETAVNLKEKAAETMRSGVTLTGMDFFLIGAVCFLAGICIGLLTAPLTHGVSIFSHNANNGSSNFSKNGNDHGNQYYGGEDEEV